MHNDSEPSNLEDSQIQPLKIANSCLNFITVLAHVVNSSFEQGVIPQALKTAKVVQLCENQYGFRPARSCEHALLNAKDRILNAMSKKQVTLLLLIDFSKAFDLVDHSILLNKLEHYQLEPLNPQPNKLFTLYPKAQF